MRWLCSPQEQPPSTVGASQLTIHCILRAVGQTRPEQRASQESQDLQHVVLRARGPWLWGIADASASQFQLIVHRWGVLSHVGLHGFSPSIFEMLRRFYFTNEGQLFHQDRKHRTERSGRDERDSVAGYRDGQPTTSDRSTCTAHAPKFGSSRAIFYWAAIPSAVPGIITSTPAAIRLPVSGTTTHHKYYFGATQHWSWYSHHYRCEAVP